MTTYYDSATLGSVYVSFDIHTNDGIEERVRTTAYVPSEEDKVNVLMQYKSHAFKFENKVLVGVRNGTPEFKDPAENRQLSKYVAELERAVIETCNSKEAFKRGQLPEGLIEVLRCGADIEPYLSKKGDYEAA